MEPTNAGADIEILDVDGVTYWPMALAAVYDDKGEELPRSLQSSLAASDADRPLAEWLETVIHRSWIRGVGLDYNEAQAVYTRTGGYAMPAGAVTAVAIPGGGTSTPIVAFAEYGGDIWAAEEGTAGTGGRVLRLVGGTGAAFANSTLVLGAGEILRDLLVTDDGAGTTVLFASSTDTGGGNGRLHRWNGAAWASSAVGAYGANGRNKMRRVFWTTNDGVGAWRLVSISGPGTIAYTLPNADPLANSATSWVEGVKIVTDSHIDELASARQHIWVSSKTNIYDLNSLGESPALLGYDDHTPDGLPFPLQYFDGYLYRAGAGTLNRIRVDEGAVLDEYPGQCAPGWGTAAESEWRGYPTAFTIDQGYLVTPIFNPTTQRTGIFWGKPRSSFAGGIEADTPNPLIWYGPECVSLDARRVTAMMSSMLVNRRLWIGSLTLPGSTPHIAWQSLPVAGAPIPDLISAGPHRYATGDGAGPWNASSSLRSMPITWQDQNSPKYVHQVSLATRGLDVATGTQQTMWLRADPPLGSVSYSGPVPITVDPSTTYTPALTTAGYKIDYRVDWTSPSGNATLAANVKVSALDEVRTTAWRIAPSFRVLTLDLEYGDGVLDHNNHADETKSPDDYTTALLNLTRGGRTVIRDPLGNRYSFKIRQVLDLQETFGTSGPYGKTVRARIVGAVLGAA